MTEVQVLVLFLSLFALVFVAALGGQAWYERHRAGQLAQIASDLGLAYQPTGDLARLESLGQLPLFKQGEPQRISSLIEGKTESLEVALFDYRFHQSGAGDSKRRTLTVVHVRSPRIDLPAFTLAPEFGLNRALGSAGANDIDFECHPRFSDLRVLAGEDEPRIRAMFNDELLSFFEEQPRYLNVQAADRDFIVHLRDRMGPRQVRELLNLALELERHMAA